MSTTTLPRRLGGALLAALLTMGVAACGSGDGGSGDGSSSPAELKELSGDELYPAIMEAVRDAGTFSMETAFTDDEDETMTMAGDVRIVEGGVEMTMSSDGEDAMEMVYVDDKMWMKADSLTSDGKWADVTAAMTMFVDVTKGMDPEAIFAPVEEPSDVELVGQEEIDGVETNHYRVTVKTAEVLESGGGMVEMADMFPEEMVLQLWIDADNLPRKQEQVLEMKSLTGEEGETELVSTTVSTFSDYGKDVDIEAPPADEVSDEDPFAFMNEKG